MERRRSSLAGLLAVLSLAGVTLRPGQPCLGDPPPSPAGYRFLFSSVSARPGERVTVAIRGEYEQSAQGFSVAARYPGATLAIERVHQRDTILEAIGSDFLEFRADPVAGVLTVGVLVDSKPPFTGALIPSIGQPLVLLYLEVTVSAEAEEDQVIRLEDGLGSPPIRNLYVVDDHAVPVTELTEGVVRIERPEVAAFLRGDTNLDGTREISDAVHLLRVRFQGRGSLACLEAADINDDGGVDLSDAVFLLLYLFRDGRPPAPPADRPGPDPRPPGLGCERPLLYMLLD